MQHHKVKPDASPLNLYEGFSENVNMQVCIHGGFCDKRFSVSECLLINAIFFFFFCIKRWYFRCREWFGNTYCELVTGHSCSVCQIFAMTFGIQTEAAVMPMTDVSVRLPRDSTFGFFSPNLHSHAYLHQNSPSMKGLADAFTTTQTHRAAYPLNITSIPLIYFIANHFKETISGFSSLGLPVCVCLIYVCESTCFLAYYV